MLDVILKLHRVLTQRQKRHYLWLQALFAVTAVIQVAGAASVAPFIALLSNPTAIHTNPVTIKVYEWTKVESDVQFLMLFAVAVMMFTIASNLVVALTSWIMFRFSFQIGTELQHATYKSYVSKDFTYYGKTNSSRMVVILQQEISRYIYNVVLPFLTLSSQLFVALLILAGLIFIDPILAIAAGTIVVGGYLFVFKLLKNRLLANGENLWALGNLKLKLLSESLGGIKEIKLLGSESLYTEELNRTNLSIMQSQALLGMSADLPKFIIETIAFCALMGLALYLLSKHGSSPEVISILSLYAMAGYKLLPAGQAIYKAASQIKANGNVLNEFIDDAIQGRSIEFNQEKMPPLPVTGEITLINVFYRYPGASSDALQDINLTIKANSITAFIGASGAGKSTLADLILGMLHPNQGSMNVGSIEITRQNAPNWQRNLGYVPQNIFIIDDSIKSNIAFGIPPAEVNMAKVVKAAEMANISEFINSLSEKYEYVVGERGALLSGGQRQRIGIARALYHDAKILILDEATSALDNSTEAEIIATLNELRKVKTVIMIAHRLSTIQAANTVVAMKNGRIINHGSYEYLEKTDSSFREILHLSEPLAFNENPNLIDSGK